MSDTKQITGVLVAYRGSLGWAASRKNKEKTREICDHDNASEDSGSWSDHLFPPKACGRKNAFTELRRHLGRMRTYTYDHSFIFEDELWRILPEKAISGFKQIVETDGEATAKELLEKLIVELPDLKAKASQPKPAGRGEGYKDSDYPTPSQIRSMFHYSVQYRPVPSSAGLNPALFQEAINELNELHERRLQEANETLIRRFLEPLKALGDQLANPENKKIKTVLESIMEISALVPSLDLNGNTELAEQAIQVHSVFQQVTPELLRENEQVQKLVQQVCGSVVSKLDTFGQVGKRAFA